MSAPIISFSRKAKQGILSHCRGFHAQLTLNNNVKSSKTMQKLLNKANRKKDTKWYSPTFTQTDTLNAGNSGKAVKPKRRYSEGMLRRAKYISTVMHEAVSQIIGSGELGVYVSLQKVEVLPDLSHMNIHWQGSGDLEQDKATQLALDAQAKGLRHTLIHSHLMGNVPRPVFVKDLTATRQSEVEEILRKISLEEMAETKQTEEKFDRLTDVSKVDFDGTEVKKSSKEETSAYEELPLHNQSSHVWNTIKSNPVVENLHDRSDDLKSGIVLKEVIKIDSTKTNQFRQDLYGLEHDVLMKKVLDAKKLSKQRPAVSSDYKGEGQTMVTFSNIGKAKIYKAKVEKTRSKKEILREMESKIFTEDESKQFYEPTVFETDVKAPEEEDVEINKFVGEKYFKLHQLLEKDENDSKT